MTIKIQALKPGQEVAVANCVATGRVARRVGNGQYAVEWKGEEITISRRMLGVNVLGRWKFGPYNAR